MSVGTQFPVSDYPSYDNPEQLLKDLRAQKFTIEDISDGWRITSPYTGNSTVQHRSSVPRAGIAQLSDMGFVPPARYKGMKACSDCGARFYGIRAVTEHKIKEHGLKLECKFGCGFTTMNMDKMKSHVKTKHPKSEIKASRREKALAATAPTPTAPATPKPVTTKPKVTRRKAEPVRDGHVPELQVFMNATDTVIEAIKALQDIHKELYAKYQKDHRKLNAIEEKLGKVLDAL